MRTFGFLLSLVFLHSPLIAQEPPSALGNKIPNPPKRGPVVVHKVQYTGTLSEKKASFLATLSLECTNKVETVLPLLTGDIAVTGSKLPEGLRLERSGKGYLLSVNKPGEYEVELNILAKITRADPWRKVEFTGPAATIALTPVDHPDRYGVVPTDDNGRVLGFIEKPPAGDAITNLVNAGTYVFEPSVLDRIPAGRPTSVEREIFPAMAADGTLFAMASDDYWVDAGTPASYLAANLHLVDNPEGGTHPEAYVDPTALVCGSVIGRGAVVAPGASVDASLVLDGATIRENARVEGSIIGPGANIAAGASVAGLSVVGSGAAVESGERLDGIRRPEPEG